MMFVPRKTLNWSKSILSTYDQWNLVVSLIHVTFMSWNITFKSALTLVAESRNIFSSVFGFDDISRGGLFDIYVNLR